MLSMSKVELPYFIDAGMAVKGFNIYIKNIYEAQHNYGQIQKEALSIVYDLKRFNHYHYGQKFIVVANHKSLRSNFFSAKSIFYLAINCLTPFITSTLI